MGILRYLSRRLAEAACYSTAAGAAAFGIGMGVSANWQVGIVLAAFVSLPTALATWFLRATPLGWEHQMNDGMGPSQHAHDSNEAARLGRQWFKWW